MWIACSMNAFAQRRAQLDCSKAGTLQTPLIECNHFIAHPLDRPMAAINVSTQIKLVDADWEEICSRMPS